MLCRWSELLKFPILAVQPQDTKVPPFPVLRFSQVGHKSLYCPPFKLQILSYTLEFYCITYRAKFKMFSTNSQFQLSPFIAILFAYLGRSATSASGPTAYISLAASPAYATMHPCAATYLVYQGIWSCPFNSGYYDLGLELSCGCSPQNFCYCDSKPSAAASASSYISSCASNGCGADFPDEVTSAIDLYNGYCSTANVAAAVQTSAPSVTPHTSTAKSTPVANSPNTNLDANANDSSSSTSGLITGQTSLPETSSATTSEKKGLAQSDVIALAVGLGVGLPNLLLALATFCLQRKRKEKQNRVTTEIHYVK